MTLLQGQQQRHLAKSGENSTVVKELLTLLLNLHGVSLASLLSGNFFLLHIRTKQETELEMESPAVSEVVDPVRVAEQPTMDNGTYLNQY